jgi:hypothetical protein
MMAKNQNTFAKRQREADKKRKAQDKRNRREVRKDAPPEANQPKPLDPEQPT